MSFKFVFQRMRDQWRTLLVLLVAVCLMTSFFGLSPLYLRYANETLLRYFIRNSGQQDDKLVLGTTTEIEDETRAILDDNLSFMIQDAYSYQRSGYDESLAQVQTLCNFIIDHCHQVFAFGNYIDEFVTLVEGRMPDAAPSEEESPVVPTIEVVISDVVANDADLEVGDNYNFSALFDEAYFTIVGIVRINDPTDHFWSGNRIFTTGAYIPRDFRVDRYDWGMMIHPQSYRSWGWQLFAVTTYAEYVDLDTSVINAVNVAEIIDLLERTPLDMQRAHSAPLTSVNGLLGVLMEHQGRLQSAESPIIFLSALLLVIMLYNLVTTVRLAMELRLPEFSILNARGIGWWQIVRLQLIPSAILAIIAGVGGVFLSKGLLLGITQLGPFSGSENSFNLVRDLQTPVNTPRLSAIAAFACLWVLVYPILRPSQLNIVAVKQAASRPITRPGWARLFLDFVFVGIGFLLILRLYWIHGGDFNDLLDDVGSIPTRLVRQISDNVAVAEGFSDPFNAIAPTLILAGSALLWLRVFPRLMRGLSRGVKNIRSLGVPLAIWNVERNTTHYGQFVLMLISTLAIGTASLSLQQTQEAGAWDAAREETGGHARLELDPNLLDDQRDWLNVEGVSDSIEFMDVSLRPNQVQTLEGVHVIGIDPDAASSSFGDLVEGIDVLEAFPVAGLELPVDAQFLEVDLRSESIADDRYPEVMVQWSAYVYDDRGFGYEVEMLPPYDLPYTPPDEWLTFSGELPSGGHAPFHLWRVAWESEQEDHRNFQHIVYLDNWRTLNAEGGSTIFESYDADHLWEPTLSELPFIGAWQNPDPERDKLDGISAEKISLDDTSDGRVLKVDYRMSIPFNSSRSNTPSLSINTPLLEPIPIVVSPAFLEVFRGEYGTAADLDTVDLEVGDERQISLNLEQAGNLYTTIHIVGTHEDFPTLSNIANDIYMIMPLQSARFLINQNIIFEAQVMDINRAWLEFETLEPTLAAQEAIESVSGVDEANYAYIRYGEILREPIATAVSGIFYGGFWISLILSLVNFTFYIFVTAKQRSFSFGVLRSLGWNINNIWRLLLFEQAVLVVPAVFIGSLLGMMLAYLLLPFMALPGVLQLQLPLLEVGGIVGVLSVSFLGLLVITSLWLRQMSITQLMRLGEE